MEQLIRDSEHGEKLFCLCLWKYIFKWIQMKLRGPNANYSDNINNSHV